MRDDCLRILRSEGLEAKLAPLAPSVDPCPGPALRIDRPARATSLRLVGGAERLPRPAHLGDPAARARCLARFAHHELMAVELFAWALLRWPGLVAGMLWYAMRDRL